MSAELDDLGLAVFIKQKWHLSGEEIRSLVTLLLLLNSVPGNKHHHHVHLVIDVLFCPEKEYYISAYS